MKITSNGKLGTPAIERGRIIGLDCGGDVADLIARWKLEGDSEPDESAEVEYVEAPFSLVCDSCSFDGPDTRAEAVREGWANITFTPEMMGQNYGGQCPKCQQAEAAEAK